MIISRFVQTPFISHDDKNMFYVRVEDWDFCNSYGVQAIIRGKVVYEQNVFAQEFSLMLPCFGENVTCKLILTPFEDMPVEKEFIIKPSKHWQIPILYSSHEDLGYCAYIDKLHYECYEYLKMAMELCEKRDGFKYMIEHFWWLDAFDCYASDAEKEQLKQMLKTGKMELNAVPSGIHTSWSNSEQLVRSMYFGCRDAKMKYGVQPKCAMYADISGVSWPAIDAFSKMGIKYMALFPNNFRNNEERADTPPLFWWKSKNEKERMLLWYQRAYRPSGLGEIWCDTKRQYPEGEFYFDTTKALKTEKWITDKLVAIGEVAYDILPLCFYDDREMPTSMLLTVCEEMKKRWKYPEFRMEIPSVFMAEIEEKYGNTLPEFTGEIADQWADFATIAPRLLSKRREVSRMLYDAEMLSTINCAETETTDETEKFRKAVWSMSEFDEHCWATSSKHPQKMHRYNIEKVKRLPIEQAASDMEYILERVCGQPNQDRVSVINTVPQKRYSHLRTEKDIPIPQTVQHQILPDDSVVSTPISFRGAAVHNFAAALPDRKSVEIPGDFFETKYYKVKFSKTAQKITSIVDQETGRELLDQDSRFEFGQFVYLYSEHKMKPDSYVEVPKKIDFRVYEGDVAYVIVQEGYEEQSGARLHSQFIFYKEEKNIDVDLSYENALGLIGDFHDRYKKNYFFAFPFLIENPSFYTESAAGEINEKTDRIPINAADFTVTQNWAAAENEQGGVAVYSRDMPVFHIGRIKYNRFETEFNENKAHYFLYASSNRSNNLIYTDPKECCAKYQLSILPYAGSHSDIVPEWSNQKDHNLRIGKAVERDTEYLSVEQDNIRLVSLKKAEDDDNAVVLRLIETKGISTEGRVKLYFTPERAMYATNCEWDTGTAVVEKDTVSFHIDPYSYVTLKLYGEK